MGAIVLDTETTGFSPHEHRMTEIAMVSYENSEVLFHSLINPEQPIPPHIVEITGIDDAMVVDAPTFAQVANTVAEFICAAEAMIGHNVYFDRGMLSAAFNRLQIPVRFPVAVCTKRVWDIYEPREERHLSNAFKRFVDRNGFQSAHRALADTIATRDVLRGQFDEFELHGKPWTEIDPEQTKWMGPSNHVIIVDGVLIFNVGKHKGIPCHTIDPGFWRWLVTKDFPEHVKELADYLTIVKPGCSSEDLYGWSYGRWG